MSSATHGSSDNLANLPATNPEVIQWARDFPKKNTQEIFKKSRRYVSLDDTDHSRYDSGSDESRKGSPKVKFPKQRALSAFSPPNLTNNLVMHPLNFEAIDVVNTPLSSLRSCSEFNKQNSYHGKNGIQPHSNDESSKSIFTSFFAWAFKSKKVRVNTGTLKIDEQQYLVEQLRFRPPSKDDDIILAETLGLERHNLSKSKYPGLLYGTYTQPVLKVYSESYGGTYPLSEYDDIDEYRKYVSKRNFMNESSIALDMVFGFTSWSKKTKEIPLKEIELREFSLATPTTATIVNRGSLGSLSSDEYENIDIDGGRLSRMTEYTELSTINSPDTIAISEPSRYWTFLSQPPTISSIQTFIEEQLFTLSRFFHARVLGDEGDFFYETIRLQPFASGAYLRGMLFAGFTNFFFTAYSLALWPSFREGIVSGTFNGWHRLHENFLYTLLVLQFSTNLVQLPLRLRIHYCCWESSRAADIEVAVEYLRDLVHSDYWIVNRGIGRCIDILSVFCLVYSESFLWISDKVDPLRAIFVSISATISLSIFVRLVVGTAFTLSMHDPQVLSDARRRGLSRWDLESLPTFVFANNDEVNNCDCPICLCNFDMGEMLISLPCNHKHSFHAACIRQWLQRQNSCPLCQKLV